MTILLTILKILGIVLLLILGILLLGIALVLFHPVQYQVMGELEEQTYVQGKVSWLFRILSWRFSWDGKEFTSGFYVFGRKPKKKEAEEGSSEDDIFSEEKTVPADENFSENDFSGGAETKDRNTVPEKESISKEEGVLEEAVPTREDILKEEAVPEENVPLEEKTISAKKGHQKKHFFTRIKEKIVSLLYGIRQFGRKLMDTLKNFNEKKQEVMSLLSDEANKKTVKGIFGELFYLLKHLRVRKIATNLTFSAGDPALTGQVLGGLCLIPFLYRKGVGIYPDFEAEKWYIKGNFKAEGHARGIHFACSTIRLWKDKNLRRFIKRFRKG